MGSSPQKVLLSNASTIFACPALHLLPLLLLITFVTSLINPAVASASAFNPQIFRFYFGQIIGEEAWWPPVLSSPHGDVKKFLQEYSALPPKEKWAYHEKLAGACIQLIREVFEGKDAEGQRVVAMLSLIGSPQKHDEEKLNRSMHAHASEYLSPKDYYKWEQQWRYCEPIFHERTKIAMFVNQYENYAKISMSGYLNTEELRHFWKSEVLELSPQQINHTLRRMKEEGGQSAYHVEVFHRRHFPGMRSAEVVSQSNYFQHFISSMGVHSSAVALGFNGASSPTRAYVEDLITIVYSLLNHCYGAMEGKESYEEERFTSSAISMARRYIALDEGVKEELSTLFPKASRILLDKRLHSIYSRLFVDESIIMERMLTKPAIVCYMLNKLSLALAFSDALSEGGDGAHIVEGQSANQKTEEEEEKVVESDVKEEL